MSARKFVTMAVVFTALSALPIHATTDEDIARAEEQADLFAALQAAPNEEIADAAVTAIWELWQTAPDEEAQAMLDSARARMRNYDFAGAMEYLDALVAYAPDYAEGWNTRATTLFLQEKYDHSLDDVAKTLALEPNHFGALAGKAVILMRQGRMALSQEALRQAVEVNPFLRERAMLVEVPE